MPKCPNRCKNRRKITLFNFTRSKKSYDFEFFILDHLINIDSLGLLIMIFNFNQAPTVALANNKV